MKLYIKEHGYYAGGYRLSLEYERAYHLYFNPDNGDINFLDPEYKLLLTRKTMKSMHAAINVYASSTAPVEYKREREKKRYETYIKFKDGGIIETDYEKNMLTMWESRGWAKINDTTAKLTEDGEFMLSPYRGKV